MLYKKELEFFKTILKNYRINSTIVLDGDKSFRGIDHGLRDFLDMQDDYDQFFCMSHESLEEKVIYKITDAFYCNYIFIVLPESVKKTFIAGPFVDINLTQEMLMQSADVYNIPRDVFSQVEKFYASIPVYTDKDIILSLFNAIGELLWGNVDNFVFKDIDLTLTNMAFPEIVHSFNKNTEDALLAMEMLESRYGGEQRMMQAIAQGQIHKAEQIISHSSALMLEMRVTDPIRNIRNYSIIINTLCRKAAEQGGVHPLYIDGISTDFAKRIEKIQSVDEGIKLHHEMIHQYCSLVKSHSLRNHSLLVQKVITLVDFDLAADLSLSQQAQLLNVNASYLSTLFKKETGMTLTEYVSKKRMEHAAYLLTTSSMQIQTIAQNCGIYDVNYFTKMFKKHTGKTPKEYRESIIKF